MMSMIDVMTRLAELDARNPMVVKENRTPDQSNSRTYDLIRSEEVV